MAKKSKRQNRRRTNEAGEAPAQDPLVTNRPSGFNPDYHFVIKDIRRVGILAGSFIGILIILAILLH